MRDAAEFADDAGQRGGDDALVDRGQAEDDHQADEHLAYLTTGRLSARSIGNDTDVHRTISPSGPMASRIACRASGVSSASLRVNQSARLRLSALTIARPFSVATRPTRRRSSGLGASRRTIPAASIALICALTVGPRKF